MNYFLFALRNLKRKGIRSWLTLIGIFIGIAAVVSLMSLGDGLKIAVTSQFGIESTEIISVQAGGSSFSAPGSDVVKPLTKSDVRAINELSSVEFAVGRTIETIKLEYNDVVQITSAVSIDEEYEKELYSIMDIDAEFGRLLKPGDSKKVLLGNNFYNADTNGFDKTLTAGKEILVNGESFNVVGILNKKGSFIYDASVMIFDKDLEELAGYGENVDIISIKVHNKDFISKAKEDIEKLLRERRNVDVGSEDFVVSTPESTLSQVNQVLDAIQIFVIIIASISILIGAVGIINTMTTSVLERRREIGIMKSIGARNSQIFLQFFIESGFLGIIGGAVGIIFGTLIGYFGTLTINNFFGATTLPRINFSLIFFSLLGSFVIGSAAGIFPAMKAARQNPIHALREES